MNDKEWKAHVEELERQAERQVRDALALCEIADGERDEARAEVKRLQEVRDGMIAIVRTAERHEAEARAKVARLRELLSEWLDDDDTYDNDDTYDD